MSLQTLIGVPVEAPPLEPMPYGLVATAAVESLDGHEIGGISWMPEGANPYEFAELCGGFAATVTRAAARDYLPFWVITHDVCSAFGFDVADYQQRAVRQLLAVESKAVEEQFERGTLTASAPNGDFKSLQDSGGTPATEIIDGGTANTSRRALALLDQAIGNAFIGKGMIHASPAVGQLWYEDRGLTLDSRGRWTTASGNVVVIGQGYWGVREGGGGQDGDSSTVATTEWAYATDLIKLYRGSEVITWPDTMAQAADRAENTVTFWAARAWAIQWSRNLHAAVNVTV